jgi:hypothetical protein
MTYQLPLAQASDLRRIIDGAAPGETVRSFLRKHCPHDQFLAARSTTGRCCENCGADLDEA